MKASLAVLLILAAPTAAFSQAIADAPSYKGLVYATALAGACQHGFPLFGGGGGGEAIFWKGISLGGEASYQSFTDGWGIGYFTLQPGFHFKGRNRKAKWDPFVTAGFGGAVSNDGGRAAAGNLGGGVNYWFSDRTALRITGRIQGAGEEGTFVFGIGVSFR
jgi:hypothetical protein